MSTTHQVPLPGPPSGPSSFVQDDRPSILQRHPTYYKDSQVVLKVEDRLFYFDKALLCQFDTFKDMFEGATAHNHDATEGLSGDNPITLQGITAFQMESLDTVVRASWTHGEPKLELDQWKAILQLCTMWECSELRDYSIRKIEEYKLNPMDSILLAAKCRVEKWLKPAYTELCIRADPLTIEDATHLGLPLFAFLCQLREKCRFEGPINSNGKRKKCGCNHYKTMSSPSQETVETAMNDISQSLLWPPIPEEMPHTPIVRLAQNSKKPNRDTFGRSTMTQAFNNEILDPPANDYNLYAIVRVEEVLYRVNKAALCQFREVAQKIEAADREDDQGQDQGDEQPVVLEGITPSEMEIVLKLLDARWYKGDPNFNLNQWGAILHVATLWEFPDLRELAIRKIEHLQPPPVNSILLARKCHVKQWFKPAYISLCTQEQCLTAEEGISLGIHLFADLTRIREGRIKTPVNNCGCGQSLSLYCNYCGNRGPLNINASNDNVNAAVEALLATENH